MLLHCRPSSKISPSQNPWSSNYKKHFEKPVITQLISIKSHNSHSLSSHTSLHNPNINANKWKCSAFSAMGMIAAAMVLSTPPPSEETLSNIPQTLSGKDCDSSIDLLECEGMKVKRIQKPKSRNAESCTSKCVTTCTRGGGGEGSPGEGPLNLRGPIVVFKQGFRSRQYCLVECSDICNLLDDASNKTNKGR